MKKLTNEQFIERAKEIHGNKYDYSKIEYVNQNTKIKILCYTHGLFEQRPDHHLAGHNCKLCSINIERFFDAKNIFLKKANEIWKNFYNYSKVNYKTW